MKTLKERFVTITRRRHICHLIHKKIELLERQKVVMARELDEFQNLIDSSEHDLDALKKMTLSSLINTLLTDKIEKLEKEEENLYTLKLKHEKLKDQYNRVIRECEGLRTELIRYGDCEDDYALIMDEMSRAVLKKDPEEADKLKSLLEQQYQYEKDHILYNDAIREGLEVQQELNTLKGYLEKAKSWGNYDETHEDLIAAVRKYQYLDEAEERLHMLQWFLHKFHNALEHLGYQKRDPEVLEFIHAPNYWIEEIFTEYSLLGAVNQLIRAVNDLLVEIMTIDETLRKESANSIKKKEAVGLALEHFFARVMKDLNTNG